MKILEFILFGFIAFLVGLTSYFFKKHRKLKRKRKKMSKYDMVEVSELDHQYSDYYEPEIVEVISSIEYL
ncbi:MAG: hypothetical protein IKF71_05790 [Bacilli bacterium]|nr:hypothetical protein [Bacilli bacterium]